MKKLIDFIITIIGLNIIGTLIIKGWCAIVNNIIISLNINPIIGYGINIFTFGILPALFLVHEFKIAPTEPNE